MSCNGGRVPMMMPFTFVAAVSAGGTSLPAGPWREVGDADIAVSMGEMRGKLNTLTVTPRIEYTNDVRSVAGGINVGSSISANGILDPTTPTDISTLRAYRFCRPAWYLVGDGSNLGGSMMGGTIVMLKS
ncbi:MAG: hypothetical protein KC656_09540 [Myxococcales bacterium]|nr:hypothetical protein [Myxococcales bacterium]MCA9568074.1 hypothetical protein [Myxococcales bacterium]